MAFSATLALPLGAWRVGSISNPLLQLDSKTFNNSTSVAQFWKKESMKISSSHRFNLDITPFAAPFCFKLRLLNLLSEFAIMFSMSRDCLTSK